MTDPLATIKELLPKLDANGRAQVKAWLQPLSQFDPVVTIKRGKVDHSADDEGLILASLHRVMLANGLEHSSPNIMKRANGYHAFKAKVPGLARFARNASPSSRTVQQAIIDLGWSLILRYLRSVGVITTPNAVMNHAHMMVPCIEQAFPGYMRNGMLERVIRTSVAV
jgi:hypothetical protein